MIQQILASKGEHIGTTADGTNIRYVRDQLRFAAPPPNFNKQALHSRLYSNHWDDPLIEGVEVEAVQVGDMVLVNLDTACGVNMREVISELQEGSHERDPDYARKRHTFAGVGRW